jgi:hypothetical protein
MTTPTLDEYVEVVDEEPRLELMEAARLFLRRYGHHALDNQICLQRPERVSSLDPKRYTAGCGSLERSKSTYHARDFVKTWRDTEWVQPLIDYVEAHSGGIACRARLMTMKPKTCLSYHKDSEKWRYHFVVLSHTSSLFIVENKVYAMPVTGGVYRLRTDLLHTALNASLTEDRTHLVISVAGRI